jgi:hypothetical protein
MEIFFSYLFKLHHILHKLLKISLKDQLFYLSFQGMIFFNVMIVVMVKVTELVRILYVNTTIHEIYGYRIKFLPYMGSNTFICIVVNGADRSLENNKKS